jgi:hypothetical protein
MNVKRDSEPVRRIQFDAMRGGELCPHPDLAVVEELHASNLFDGPVDPLATYEAVGRLQ